MQLMFSIKNLLRLPDERQSIGSALFIQGGTAHQMRIKLPRIDSSLHSGSDDDKNKEPTAIKDNRGSAVQVVVTQLHQLSYSRT